MIIETMFDVDEFVWVINDDEIKLLKIVEVIFEKSEIKYKLLVKEVDLLGLDNKYIYRNQEECFKTLVDMMQNAEISNKQM